MKAVRRSGSAGGEDERRNAHEDRHVSQVRHPLTPRELGDRAGLSDQAILRCIRDGKLHADEAQRGKSHRYMIPPDECQRFLNERAKGSGYAGDGQEEDEVASLRRELQAERDAYRLTRDELEVLRGRVARLEEVARRLNQALVQRSAHLVLEAQSAALEQFLVPDTLND